MSFGRSIESLRPLWRALRVASHRFAFTHGVRMSDKVPRRREAAVDRVLVKDGREEGPGPAPRPGRPWWPSVGASRAGWPCSRRPASVRAETCEVTPAGSAFVWIGSPECHARRKPALRCVGPCGFRTCGGVAGGTWPAPTPGSPRHVASTCPERNRLPRSLRPPGQIPQIAIRTGNAIADGDVSTECLKVLVPLA